MTEIHKLYLLLTRDFPDGTANSSMRKILQMRANGRTYESQLASTADIVTKVVGNFPVSDPMRVWMILSMHELLPLGLSSQQLASIFDKTTFGWFEFDNGVKGAVAADFSLPAKRVSPAVQFKVTGATLEEARVKVRAINFSPDLSVSEEVVSGGLPQTIYAGGDTLEEASAAAVKQIPTGRKILDKCQIAAPSQTVHSLEAFDDAEARRAAERLLGKEMRLISLCLISPGKSGFLGLGRQKSRYEATINQRALVSVTYSSQEAVIKVSAYKK